MRHTGWARIDYYGDPLIAQQYVPLARLLIGQVINQLKLSAAATNSSRREAYEGTDTTVVPVGLGSGSISRTYPDGTQIDAGYTGTVPWARITAGTTSETINPDGYGFILSPFNNDLPATLSPDYKSTLLLINGGAYVNDYPDSTHHWFTAANNGNYLDLGGEFTTLNSVAANNGLLQGNLHWRSAVDKTFHLSWLGNPSDPIPYFTIGFQDGYDSGNSPYAVRLSSSTITPPQTGQIFNFDTTQVFSTWLADSFGGLHNLQNGTGVGQVICYKGHVVKPVYDLLKPGSPVTVRNCIIGVGGTVDPKTLKRTLYFVVRAFEQQLPTYVLTETVYSLDIDNPLAGTLLLNSRTINTTGSYNTPITVDAIPLHGYYWDESNTQFVCLAVAARTTPANDISTQPTFQKQSVFSTTGKAIWKIAVGTSGASANFSFDTSFDMARGLTTQPTWKLNGTFNPNTIIAIDGTEYPVTPDEVIDQSFKYALSNAVIAITDKNSITTSLTAAVDAHNEAHGSGVYSPTKGFQFQTTTSKYTTTFSQSIAIGSKTFDVAELTLTSNDSDVITYDATFSHVSEVLNDAETMTYTGKSFLWFSDTDQVYAYLEYQLQWNRTLTNNYGPIPVSSTAPLPTENYNLVLYQGRFVVDSAITPQTGEWFDLSAGGQIGNTPSHSNLYAFMPKLPIRLNPGAGNDGSYTIITNTPTSQVFEKDFGPNLPLFELVNILSFSYFDRPKWQPSSQYFTSVDGRITTFGEPDGTYTFSATHPGGWALNGKRLCFSQVGPRTLDTLGNTLTQSPFQFLTGGDLDTLTGTNGDTRGNYPLCYIPPKEIKAQGQS